MSAIFGIIGGAERAELDHMSARLAHRGSSSTVWNLGSGIYIGQNENHASGQDISAMEKPVLFDGIIYNLSELREILGYKTDDAISTNELILRLYKKIGPQAFGCINGQFSVAILEPSESKLVLASDPWGTKPLYYARDGKRLIFASEYKAILAVSSFPAQPDIDIFQYLHLTKYIPPGSCCLRGVKSVAGGSYLEISNSGERINTYNKLSLDIDDLSINKHSNILQQKLLGAIDRQTRSLDRIGISLSGGVDSLLITAAVKKVAPDKPVYTYSAGFGPEDDNILGAAEVADHFDTIHHEIYLAPHELPALIPKVLWDMEDPIGREEKIYYYSIAKKASESVKTILAGHNADALFGGMPRHLVAKIGTQPWLPRKPLEEFYNYTQTGRRPETILGSLLIKLYFKGKDVPPPALINTSYKAQSQGFPRGKEALNKLLKDSLCHGPNANSAIERIHSGFGMNFCSPFLDIDFVRYAFHIPDKFKVHGLKQKYILRKAGTGLVPDWMLKRKKGLFRLQHDREFCDVLDTLTADRLSRDAVESRGLLSWEYVDKIKNRGQRSIYSTEQIYRLWSLILTEEWCRIFIDSRGAQP